MLKALEVSQLVGVRVLLIHAKNDEAKSLSTHYGFLEAPFDSLVLMMLLGEPSPQPNLALGCYLMQVRERFRGDHVTPARRTETVAVDGLPVRFASGS